MRNKIKNYGNGALIGMVGEYLYRVEFSIIPFSILILLVFGAYIDVKYKG